jgi:pathogenesis-related protein 1
MMAATIRAILVLAVLCVASFANAQPTSGYRSALDQRSMSQAMLDAHNAVRARVGVPPLIWSDRLATVAQDWANYLIATNAFSHRPNDQFGENPYMITGATASPANVVGMWADEAREFDIRSNTCSGMCGHYTQIVWRETRAVGCAVVANPYREVWVCN